MTFEDQIFLIPLMPYGMYCALNEILRETKPLPNTPEKLVEEGDLVNKGDILWKYLGESVVAPFSGKIIFFNQFSTHCHPLDWKLGEYPKIPARHITEVTLFAIQPELGENTINPVYKSYLNMIKSVTNEIAEARGNTRFAGKKSGLGGMYGSKFIKEAEEFRQQVMVDLDKLKHSEAQIAPVGVTIDEYFYQKIIN